MRWPIVPRIPDDVNAAMDTIRRYRQTLRVQYEGKFVYVPHGKYKGRVAKIAYVDWDDLNGPHVCLYVMRKDGSGTLNSDGESRSYWPWDTIQEQLDMAFSK